MLRANSSRQEALFAVNVVKKLFVLLAVVLLLAVVAFTVWAYTPLGPMPEARAALQSDAAVQVTTEPWLSFTPTTASPRAGLIFYPGGRVDARAYAPAAHALAAQGYQVVVVPMPFNLAVFGINRAEDVIAAYPEVRTWGIGGHSLGGSMAANFAANHPGAVQGLALWASYPAGSDDLSARDDLAVVSIYGTQDGVALPADVLAARPLLPADTVWVAIEGGSHAQFGWYGPQSEADVASISREAQQQQVIRATAEFLAGLSASR